MIPVYKLQVLLVTCFKLMMFIYLLDMREDFRGPESWQAQGVYF